MVDASVSNLNQSDHFAQIVNFEVVAEQLKEQLKNAPSYRRKFTKYNVEQMNWMLRRINWSEVWLARTSQDAFRKMYESYTYCY